MKYLCRYRYQEILENIAINIDKDILENINKDNLHRKFSLTNISK